MRPLKWLFCITFIFFAFSVHADSSFAHRKDVQLFIQNMVKEYHFTTYQLTQVMKQVQLQPKIIESMERPYEKKNWDVYKAIFLTPQRLQGGLEFWQANQQILEKVQKKYKVPPEIIVAILGVETLYGARQGEYKVLDALATLAFTYPKRSAYFTRELKEFLLLCREHKISSHVYKGSYAGAMGKPQFMPSSYRYYAIDFANKGSRDLMTNNADVISSVANYFNKHGWKDQEGIAQHARLVNTRHFSLQTNPKSANYTYTQLYKAGVRPITAAFNHPKRAGLIELDTTEGKELWLAYPNFFVITRYNSSPQYALVVYLLSQQLKKYWLELHAKKHRAYI